MASPIDRWRSWSRKLTHDGLNRIRRESPPAVARRLRGFQKNLRGWERRADQARARREARAQELEYRVRRWLASNIRALERRVSGAA